MMTSTKGLRKKDQDRMYELTQGCPCDVCHWRPNCVAECPKFRLWTGALARGGSKTKVA